MTKLIDGIKQFRKVNYVMHKDIFRILKKEQKPHSLFISCSDSRIDPNMITGTLPGELFIIRNIANIVPPYQDILEHTDTISAIEYAVVILEVEEIIICGHSNCGGCGASLSSIDLIKKLPNTQKWIELMNPVKERIYKECRGYEFQFQEKMMEQGNVVQQLENLMTYSYIRQRVETGQLKLSGWYYIIETGEVYIYNEEIGEYKLHN